MAAIKYRDEHNKVGFLEKPKGSDDYHQVLDFLRGSHIRYALTHDPIIYDSLVKQFWSTASLRASKEGPPAILATIDRTPYTITESLVRSQLQLDDDGGVEDLPIADIYLGMDNLGYPSEGKLTFFKNKFSPQWRFLVHTIMHCLSTKSGSWDQFGSQLAIAIICLTEGRRFLQMILEIEPRSTKQYHAFKLTSKMFANMRRACTNSYPQTVPKSMSLLPDSLLDYMKTMGGSCHTLTPLGHLKCHPAGYNHRSCIKGWLVEEDAEPEDVDSYYQDRPSSATAVAASILSNKGKSPLLEEDPPVRERTFRQREEDNLGEEAARRMYEEEQDERSLKRLGADLEQASSKKSKSTEAPKSSVPDESQQPSVEVPSQKAIIEDVEVPSNTASTAQHTASTAQHTASSLKKVGTRKKRLGRKGVHTSHSTISIEDGDPEAKHKMCIKYASDADSASDDDTPERQLSQVLPQVLGNPSLDKKATGVGLVLWGDLKVLMDSPEVNDGSDVWKNQHTWSIQSWKLYSYSGVHVLETVSGLVVHMFVDKKYPLSVNLIERMLDHQLEICHGTVGNELTTAVQLIAFLKKTYF
ncbi:hypothetical protein Tco_0650468 [Tanacetum coccineum]